MADFTFLTRSEQMATHLREELFRERWSGTIPGVPALAAELGVDRKTAALALAHLEKEGLLVGQGPGRRRKIVLPEGGLEAPSLRVAILGYTPLSQNPGHIILLRHLLEETGHAAFFTGKCLLELGMDVKRVAHLVKRTEADAWVICAGSREVLEWFAGQGIPTMALFGRRRSVPIAGAGPDHIPAFRAVVQRLIALGHKRIVMLERQSRRTGGPGATERVVLEKMAAHGLPTGPYNLPDWEDTPEGFHRLLDELFRVTPPSALLIDGAFLFTAAQQYLARRGILAPEHVSLVCTDPDPAFAWCRPPIAHMRWDPGPVVRRVVRWANNVSRGKDDRNQSFTKAEFVEGGTVGRARE